MPTLDCSELSQHSSGDTTWLTPYLKPVLDLEVIKCTLDITNNLLLFIFVLCTEHCTHNIFK